MHSQPCPEPAHQFQYLKLRWSPHSFIPYTSRFQDHILTSPIKASDSKLYMLSSMFLSFNINIPKLPKDPPNVKSGMDWSGDASLALEIFTTPHSCSFLVHWPSPFMWTGLMHMESQPGWPALDISCSFVLISPQVKDVSQRMSKLQESSLVQRSQLHFN
ncbi:hypothetical protein O181_095040 [Austropuccinia psidii MF-1]|uniref:Uncharacterized protein n=1 Tax=Austropuccinia psidii MF-1 TaxID=1389203 RepID=A0A9Q3J4T8_9BASI|nr:hypothetical protein [Austropuccinia psidii MF-1]